MNIPERLAARILGDARLAEAIVGDLEEERPRAPFLHLMALALRLAFHRRRRSPLIPPQRTKPMSTLSQDIRYAARMLWRQPAFTLIVVLTLAVGLGANAAVFAMVDAMVFRPLPMADFDGMVQIFETNPSQSEDREGVSVPNYLEWQRQAKSFDRLLAISWWNANISDRTKDPERVVGRSVSAAFFESLHVQPPQGRTFSLQEEKAGFDRVVVVSHRLWQRRWGGSQTLVGSTITIDRVPYTVIGIAPERFEFPSGTEIWRPVTFSNAERIDRNSRYLDVIGRLKPGISIDAARVEMATIAARVAKEHTDTNAGYGTNVMLLSKAMLDLGTPALLAVLQLAVGLVLVIAGANVANLLTVRGTARSRELALRLAVGASRWRVVRQLVVESVLLSVVGVALSVPLAAAGVRVMKSFMPPEIARWILGWGEIDVDGRLLAITMISGVIVGAVFGALPALRASRPDLVDALKDGSRGSAGGRRRVLEGFVIAQVALALALLVSAGLTTRGAIRLLIQHDGYDPRGVMTFAVTLPETTYPDDAARLRFVERLLERVRVLPDVEHASFSSTVPFSEGGGIRPVEVEGRAPTTASERPVMDYRVMTPEYLHVLRAPVVRGRALTDADRAGAPLVALVDQLMAQQLWPGRDPIGQRFRSTHVADAPWLTVVGVVASVKHNWWFGFRPTYYVTYAQQPREFGVLAVRVRGDETVIAPAVRQIVREMDPELPLAGVHSLVRWRALRTVGMQFVAGLMASFAILGLFLSAIGIYGVMAYSVTQRTREIGVRMALGATARQVMSMTLRNAVILSGIGIAIGLVAAFGLGKLLAATMFGVVQLDLVTFAAFAAMLAVVAVAAGGVPARRAMRVDPISALRAE